MGYKSKSRAFVEYTSNVYIYSDMHIYECMFKRNESKWTLHDKTQLNEKEIKVRGKANTQLPEKKNIKDCDASSLCDVHSWNKKIFIYFERFSQMCLFVVFVFFMCVLMYFPFSFLFSIV